MKDKISDALLKVALGFQVSEVTEEYAEVDGALKLTKRKRTKKDVPPDLKAVQMLLGESGGTLENMSDEELEQEKKRLLVALEKAEKEKGKKIASHSLAMTKEVGQVRDEQAKTVKTAKTVSVARKPSAKPKKRVAQKKEDK